MVHLQDLPPQPPDSFTRELRKGAASGEHACDIGLAVNLHLRCRGQVNAPQSRLKGAAEEAATSSRLTSLRTLLVRSHPAVKL